MQARDILHTAMDGFWVVDTNSKFIEVNEIACKMLGYSQAEMLNMRVSDIEVLETVDQIASRIEKLTLFGEDRFESKHRCKDGRIIAVEISLKMQPTKNQIVTFIHNITERKRAEEALQFSHARLKALFKSPRDIIMFSLDKNYNYIIFNDVHRLEMKKVYNIDIAEGQNMLELINIPQVKSIVETSFQRVLNGETFEEVQELPKPNIFHQFYWNPVLTEDGVIIGISCLVIDITEQRKIEQDLKESEEKFAKVFHNAPVLIAINDYKDGTYLDVNEQAIKVSGYSREEIVGHSASELGWIQKDERILLTQMIHEKGHISDLEIKFHTKDGKTLYGLVYGGLIILGNKKKLLTVTVDITDRKKSEAELIEAKGKAEESDRLKSAFLANMSHEIRTPLNSIMGFSSLIPDEDDKDLLSNYANIIVSNSEQLLHIIDDIVLYSRLQTRMLTYRPNKFQIQYLLKNVKDSFDLPEFQNKVELKIEVQTDEIVWIDSDFEKIKQVLNNLVSNAYKYTNVGLISIGFTVETKLVKFFVKDTGIGIPNNELNKIFDRFYRASNINIGAIGGTGLGLSIVQELIELMGGKIWVESEVGKGSVFYFTLPNSINS
jgi:PAS domain S-box-containing protein